MQNTYNHNSQGFRSLQGAITRRSQTIGVEIQNSQYSIDSNLSQLCRSRDPSFFIRYRALS